MQHSNYFIIQAKNNFDCGLQKGELFGDIARNTLQMNQQLESWKTKVALASQEVAITKEYFPEYFRELEGYAKAANISFSEFWTLSIEDDFDYIDEKCTTIVTNNGKILSHNEDWGKGAENKICLLRKTIGELTTLEFFYYNTLGGASVCINSHGYIMTINTLSPTDNQIGIPRNVIARWLSETKNISSDYEKLKKLKRSLGYNHIFVNTKGGVWNLECSSTKQKLVTPSLPYVHTNHYLEKELEKFEEPGDSGSTYIRYDAACAKIKSHMTVDELIELASDTSKQKENSIYNERTIGRFIIDVDTMNAKVWMKREEERGWIDYPIDFIS